MKKPVIIAALGLVVSAVSSFGQGSLSFNSYSANVPIYFPAVFGGGPVGAGYTADLLWSLTPITDVVGDGALTAGWNLSGSGAPSVQSVATPFGTTPSTIGYFLGANNFVLDPYTAGTTVYFEVIVYQAIAGSYANSTFRGHSASFSTTLAMGVNLPTPINFTSFTLPPPIPEPATLALVGLVGLVSLATLRRKRV